MVQLESDYFFDFHIYIIEIYNMKDTFKELESIENNLTKLRVIKDKIVPTLTIEEINQVLEEISLIIDGNKTENQEENGKSKSS